MRNKKLPSWFRRPQSSFMVQTSLFPASMWEVLAKLRVSYDELSRWHKREWLSFGPDDLDNLETQHVWEIRFVRDVVRSGLSDACIEELFKELPRPFNFNPEKISYNFSLGWVEIIEQDPYEIVEEYLEPWLDQLVSECDTEKLEYVVKVLQEFIAEVKESNLEEEE